MGPVTRRWSFSAALALIVAGGSAAAVATAATAGNRGGSQRAANAQCAREAKLGSGFTAWHLAGVQFSSPTDGIGITSSVIVCYRRTRDGYATSGHRQVTQLATTADGGRFWRLTGSPTPSPGPRGGPEQLVATSPWAVWTVLGDGRLVATTDQGSRWTPQSLPGTVGEIEQGDGSVWALTCVEVHRFACHPELWRTSPPGRGWSRIRVPRLTAIGPAAIQLEVLPGALILALTEPHGRAGRFQLLHSGDGGVRWYRRTVSAFHAPCVGDLLAAAPPASAWLLCLGGGAAGSDDKVLLHSTDAGGRLRVAASATFSGHSRGHGLPTTDAVAFAAASPGRAWLAGNNSLVTTADGGVRWSRVAGVNPDGAFSVFDVLGPADAWLLGPSSGLWHTADGVHWRRVGTQNPG